MCEDIPKFNNGIIVIHNGRKFYLDTDNIKVLHMYLNEDRTWEFLRDDGKRARIYTDPRTGISERSGDILARGRSVEETSERTPSTRASYIRMSGRRKKVSMATLNQALESYERKLADKEPTKDTIQSWATVFSVRPGTVRWWLTQLRRHKKGLPTKIQFA